MKNALLYIMLVMVQALQAQSASKACVQKVREYARKIDNMPLPKDERIYFIHYNNRITMWDSLNTPTVNMEVKMYMSKDHMQYITKDIEMYQDKRDAFMIVNSRKKIIWGQSELDDQAVGKTKNMAALKDTLFDLSTPVSCTTYSTKEGREMTRLVLKPNTQAQQFFKMQQIEYVFDSNTGNIERIISDYIPEYEIKRTVVTYKASDYNYKGIKLNKPFSDKIVTKENTLQAKYKGYQLIDNR